MKALKICTDGSIETVMLPEAGYDFQRMAKAIGCRTVDILSIHNVLPEKYCLICDDEALLKDQIQVNKIATWLNGWEFDVNPWSAIAGDVLIMKDEVNEEGETVTVGLSDDDITEISNLMKNHPQRKRMENTPVIFAGANTPGYILFA